MRGGGHGAHGVGALRMGFGDFTELQNETGTGLRRPALVLLLRESNGPAFNAPGAGNDAEWGVGVLQRGAVFDVQFEVGCSVPLLLGGVAQAVDLDAAGAQGVLKRDAVAVGSAPVGLDGVIAGERRGTKEAAAKASPFLVGPVHDAKGAGRAAVVAGGERLQGFERDDYAEAAVQPTGARGGVEVAAKDDRPLARPGEGGPVIAGGVAVVFHGGKLLELLLEPVAGQLPGGRPGEALCAVFVGGELAQLFEVLQDGLHIDHAYRGRDRGRSGWREADPDRFCTGIEAVN